MAAASSSSSLNTSPALLAVVAPAPTAPTVVSWQLLLHRPSWQCVGGGGCGGGRRVVFAACSMQPAQQYRPCPFHGAGSPCAIYEQPGVSHCRGALSAATLAPFSLASAPCISSILSTRWHLVHTVLQP